MAKDKIPRNIIEKMISNRKIRTEITRNSHFMFFHLYFAHYVKYQTARFQEEIFSLTEDEKVNRLYIVAFRGSGKSTIITTSYPIWAILGKQQKKFVLILCQTRNQAKQHMINLKRELESNQLLISDLGPFQEESDEWGSSSLVFSNMNARITVASAEQSIRGLRHGAYRPDLIIGDDVEDMASAKTKEGRQKTYDWLKGEVIPTGDRTTKLVIVGNLLHEDSLLMHLKRDIDEGSSNGVFKAYPLLDDNGEILWPGKYPNLEEIEIEHKNIGNEIAWKREYLLEIVPNEDQIVSLDQIKYYSSLLDKKPRKIIVGVDLAISLKSSADFTAIVTAAIYGYGKDFYIYILPNPINRKMDFTDTLEQIKAQYDSLQYLGNRIIYVEDIGFQKIAIEQLNNAGYKTDGSKITSDKRSRLLSISNLIPTGRILFPKEGATELIENIVGFGKEKHDDLVDAFTIVAREAITMDKPSPRVFARKPMGF